ncbi:PE family protein [Mycolicibacterium doricum]|uniref:PE family protein n=1 Tax=Mycolicibacterium doricum TaxID=126673 RepID=A0A1X1TJG1_9MYCO|nr:PE-PPE domain-containing protein [Mycolicibacterium doricum]MCV7267079.1 PE-PPE domain-containing protein [Mycolicibacterium doricum]ORV44715.1 hypothetical protein AWC01_03125 [Mycolicibacterium doricum]BBZ08842.1 PE family protein [Mycolicibacterium doricum]
MVRKSVRSLALVIGAISAALAIGWSVTLPSAVHLLATVLVMGGTEHPLVGEDGEWADDLTFVDEYATSAIRVYVAPSGIGGSTTSVGYTAVAVHTPEEFAPVFGTMTFDDSVDAGVVNLDNCIQGKPCVARSVPDDQRQRRSRSRSHCRVHSSSTATPRARSSRPSRSASSSNAPQNGAPPEVSVVLIANPNRPNGGVLQRFAGLYIPLLDVTFSGETPTDSPLVDAEYLFPTIDIARQYDGWADFPVYPLNLVATTNALLGIYYLHGDYWSEDVGTPLEQGTEGDTTYYLIPTERLPLLMPFEQLGVPSPILTALDAPLRVIVEWGYDRDPENVGTPTRARLIPLVNPVTGVVDLLVAIPTGLDDGLAEAAGDPSFRPLGTDPVTSPYGVGGEDLGPELGATEVNPASAVTVADDNQDLATPHHPRTPITDRPRGLSNLAPPREDTVPAALAERRAFERLSTGSTGRREQSPQDAADTSEQNEQDRPRDRDRFARHSRSDRAENDPGAA